MVSTIFATMKAWKASPAVRPKEVVIKEESISVKPQWLINDFHLFASIEEVMHSGIQTTFTTKDMAASKLKPQVMKQIAVQYSTVLYSTVQYCTVQYSRKEGSPLDKGPLS